MSVIMKKVAMYRRNGGGNYSGLKERAVWLLSSGPMHGEELARKLRVPPEILKKSLSAARLTIDSQTIEIMFSDIERGGNEKAERLYWLAGKARRITPKGSNKSQISISKKSAGRTGEESRLINEEAAARRRRLHKNGLWVSSSEID